MRSATVELKGSQFQAEFGRVRIQCDSAALNDMLAELRRDRAQYEHSINADKGEAISNALLDQAEQIKQGVKPCH